MIKWWKLKEDNAKLFVEKAVEEANQEMTSNIEYTWTKIKTCFTQMTKEILGAEKKDKTWCIDKVKTIIKEKKKNTILHQKITRMRKTQLSIKKQFMRQS